jgi:uncharacterized protein with von Willebrand factor type A (vWA) domain
MTAAGAGDALWARVHDLASRLRSAGADVSLSELLDAAEGVRHIDLADRAQLRNALRATLVKHAHELDRFDALFDRCFPARPAATLDPVPAAGADAEAAPGSAGSPSPALGERVRAAVDTGTEEELRMLAEEAVGRHAGFEDGTRTERYHVYRVLRAVELAHLLHDALRRARGRGEDLSRADVAARIEVLRRLITEEVRARLAAADEGPLAVPAMPANPFDVELAAATATQLAEVRAAVRPLARRLAARLRRRRQSIRSGAVDMKRTVRRSVASGGVPLDVAYRRPHAHKPEVFTLCDVSGSVADFAGFTLTLISALADELARTRSFAFVDAVDEITAVVDACTGVVEPWQILQAGRVIGPDGHSDYGRVLRDFQDRYGRALTDRSTVIVTGDARTNYRPPAADLLAEIATRVRAVYWLNPEPRTQWDTTDSVLHAYAPHCRGVFEVRTLRHLADAVERIL